MTKEDVIKLGKYRAQLHEFGIGMQAEMKTMEYAEGATMANELLDISIRLSTYVDQQTKNLMAE